MSRARERNAAVNEHRGSRKPRLPRAVRVAVAILLLLTGLVLGSRSALAQQRSEVIVVDLDGAIDRVTARFLSRALDDAMARGAELVVIRIDTPGGLLDELLSPPHGSAG